jgi:DNA-directed RNA polymerase subunit M/transcription elongation factor TFIIS
MSEALKTAQNGCRKCDSEMLPSKAIVCRATGMSDFIGSKDVVTMSPDPRQPVLVDCLKCSKCGYSISHSTNNERFALV